jgi:hypothetical protein
MSRVLILLPVPLLCLASCGITGGSADGPTAVTTTKVSRLAQFSLADLRPARVPVVEVRERDLRDLPLGEERAVAYQRAAFAARDRQRARHWFSAGPVDFIEPSLPTGGPELDSGLLPPKEN